MSLTSQLRASDSPLRAWLGLRLPHLDVAQKRWRREVPAQSGTVGWGRGQGPAPWPMLGMAIDHRLRFALHNAPDLGVCLTGAKKVQSVCASPDLASQLEALVADVLVHTVPADRSRALLLEPAAEDELGRLCVVLSWMEYVYRQGVPDGPSQEHQSPLRAGKPAPDLAHMLAGVPAAALDDLRAVTATAQQGIFDRLRSSTTFEEVDVGPVFAGSRDVGGADADWVARGTLLDCKATVSPHRLADTHALYQLACYPLLDYNDTMKIVTVGIYLARQGLLVKWPLAELLAELAGDPVDVAELRADLRDHLSTKPTRSRTRQPAHRGPLHAEAPRRSRL